jgi:hypothetical protein
MNWTEDQVKGIEVGTHVRYLNNIAEVTRVAAKGLNYKGDLYCVFEAKHCDTASVSTGVSAGEPQEFCGPVFSFNMREQGVFEDGYKDQNGLPVSDSFPILLLNKLFKTSESTGCWSKPSVADVISGFESAELDFLYSTPNSVLRDGKFEDGSHIDMVVAKKIEARKFFAVASLSESKAAEASGKGLSPILSLADASNLLDMLDKLSESAVKMRP